jgi:ABC-2 type transport system permease protein
MLSLLKIEWLKIKKYPAFWWILAIVALTYPGINLMFYNIYEDIAGRKDMASNMLKMLMGNPFGFPEVWHSVAYFSSIFVLLPSILIIMIISNEYTYKTSRQNIIDGWSRNEFMMSKLSDVLIISLVATVAYIIMAAGFGFAYSSDIQIGRWTEQLQYIPLFLLQTFSQLSIAFMLGFLLRKAFLALGIFIFYAYVVENFAVLFLRYSKYTQNTPMAKVADFLPMEISDKVIPRPAFLSRFNEVGYAKDIADINLHILYTVLLTAGVWWLCFSIYRKRDL